MDRRKYKKQIHTQANRSKQGYDVSSRIEEQKKDEKRKAKEASDRTHTGDRAKTLQEQIRCLQMHVRLQANSRSALSASKPPNPVHKSALFTSEANNHGKDPQNTCLRIVFLDPTRVRNTYSRRFRYPTMSMSSIQSRSRIRIIST